MSKLSNRELERLLAARRAVEPPPDLAARIKGDIPTLPSIDGVGPGREGVAGLPPRDAGYRAFLLLAATLLVVIGVGFIAAHLLEPPADLARDVALGGLTVVDDIVVTVPLRADVDESAGPGTGGLRGDPHGASTSGPGAAPVAAADAVTVVVRRANGAPCSGAVVSLRRTDVTTRWRGDIATDAAGVAFFLGVPAGTYTLTAEMAGARPTTLEMLHVAPRAAIRVDLRIAPRHRHSGLPF